MGVWNILVIPPSVFVLVSIFLLATRASAIELKDGVYTFELVSSAASSCFLSYKNQTCARITPVTRGATSQWNKWDVRVEDKERGLVSLSAGPYGRCPNGSLGLFRSDFCIVPPYATRVVMADPSMVAVGGEELFQVLGVEGSPGTVRIVAADKPSSCARYLGALGCGVMPRLYVDGDGGAETSWKMTYVEESSALTPVEAPSPMPGANPDAAPTPTPAPFPSSLPLPAPPPAAPTLAASAMFVQGYVTITIPYFGGCDVRSFVFQIVSSQMKSDVEVPSRESLGSVGVGLTLQEYGLNNITVVGVCSDGSRTATSTPVEVMNMPVISSEGATPKVSIAYVAESGVSIQACPMTGSSWTCSTIATGIGPSAGLVIDGSTVYITNSGGSIRACPMTGSSWTCSIVATGLTGPYGLAIDGSTAYATSYIFGTIAACSTSVIPWTCATVASGLGSSLGIAIYGSTAYVADGLGGKIKACPITGAPWTCSNVATGLSTPVDIAIAIDGLTAYVLENGGGTIKACPITGSSWVCSNVATGLTSPLGMTISGSTAYIVTAGGVINACPMTGSSWTCSTVATGLLSPLAIAVAA